MLKAELTGKTAVVTAGAGTVGEVICRTFAASGASVAVCDENIEKATDIAGRICADGGAAAPFLLDIRKRETFPGICSAICETFGKIDILVNNNVPQVRPEDRKPLHAFDETLCTDILQTGLDGIYYFSKAAMQDMAKRKSGAVVNILSILGLIPVPDQTPIVALSAGCVGFTKMWGVELSDDHIRVNAVASGIVRDEKNEDYLSTAEQVGKKLSHLAVKRLALPEDIANAALFLASDEAAYITGVVLPVDGGLSAGYVRSF